MAELILNQVTRRFESGGGVSDVSIRLREGEFLVLLGPSGCGKSTLLRLIAGLERSDSGEIKIDGQTPGGTGQYRDSIAMVFQNFALYPHMTVFENIAFPLKLRGIGRAEIDRRVHESAAKAGLNFDLKRHPRELSGGERQRVALARALVREPRIVLMDEALASLDAKLRGALREELKEFQRRTGRTMIYVTHDQVEALTLADRIAVMRAGRIEQLGTPIDLFDRPQTEFVAGFVGDPPMNLFRARPAGDGSGLIAGDTRIALISPLAAACEVTIGIRPSDLSLDQHEDSIALEVRVERAEFTGAATIVHARLGEVPLGAQIFERRELGAELTLYVSPRRVHFFDTGSGLRIEPAAG